jgi:hypothetical protein
MDKQQKLRLQILVGLIVLLLLSNLYFFLIKIGGFIFLIEGLIQLTIFVCVAIWTGRLIWRIIRNSDWRKISNVLTVLAIPTAVILSGFDTLTADENTFQSDVKIRACYEGTMNTSRLYFRENGEFEDFNIGFFAHVNYVSGTWKMDADTILLTIKSGQHNLLKDKMVIKDNYLYTVDQDTIKPTFYYLGQCKGLN